MIVWILSRSFKFNSKKFGQIFLPLLQRCWNWKKKNIKNLFYLKPKNSSQALIFFAMKPCVVYFWFFETMHFDTIKYTKTLQMVELEVWSEWWVVFNAVFTWPWKSFWFIWNKVVQRHFPGVFNHCWVQYTRGLIQAKQLEQIQFYLTRRK